MALSEPRFEFRIWGDSLDAVRRLLNDLSTPGPPECSRETYIVSDATDETNVKIRADAIDLKLLLRRERRLEQWSPFLKAAFPLDAGLIGKEIFAQLRVDTPPLCNSSYDAAKFVAELIRPHPGLAAAEVFKQRWRFALEGCAAEFVEVMIDAAGLRRGNAGPGGEAIGLQSVAIESTDARSVLAAIDRLGIGVRPNVSYVRRIKSVLGRPSAR